jgi:hypothetical protein
MAEGEPAAEFQDIVSVVEELNLLIAGLVKERTALDMTIRELNRKVDGLASRVRRVESAIR